MKMMRLLIAAVLAFLLLAGMGSTIMAPSMTMFSAPDLSRISLKNIGFGQLTPTDVATKQTIFAPQNTLLIYGAKLAPQIKPRLMTNNWSESMKGSSINQMFALMANGIGSPGKIPTGHHTGI